jgi:hypothetical protein
MNWKDVEGSDRGLILESWSLPTETGDNQEKPKCTWSPAESPPEYRSGFLTGRPQQYMRYLYCQPKTFLSMSHHQMVTEIVASSLRSYNVLFQYIIGNKIAVLEISHRMSQTYVPCYCLLKL